MSLLASYTQDPMSVLDYGTDWSAWLSTGETITGSPVIIITALPVSPPVIGPALIVHTAPVVVGNVVIFWLSGGAAGQQYDVSCEITTTQGRTDVRSFTVQVQVT